MNQVYQPISIQDIPGDINFEGYYWYSNAKVPEIITDEPIQPAWFKDLPFVIEANFYSREHQLGIQVRYVDGQYQVAMINLSKVDKSLTGDPQLYIGHDLNGRNFQVIEAWQPEKDPFCEGMEVLVPSWSAFIGFVNR